jgi:hypothetical protein
LLFLLTFFNNILKNEDLMAYTKRCFDNVGALSSRNPDVLRKLLSLFPGYASIRKLDISSAELDIPSVRDALMSDEIPEALDELLYFSSALGSSTGWAMIEQQAGEDGIPLPKRTADFDDADMAVLAAIQDWPKYSSLLEKANARARIHGKSVYKYYAPASAGQKRNYRNADAASLAEAEETLRQHFVEQGYIRAGAQEKAVRIIPYDYAKEIWFLICYADTKKRFRGCQADGEWKNFDFNPEQKDCLPAGFRLTAIPPLGVTASRYTVSARPNFHPSRKAREADAKWRQRNAVKWQPLELFLPTSGIFNHWKTDAELRTFQSLEMGSPLRSPPHKMGPRALRALLFPDIYRENETS